MGEAKRKTVVGRSGDTLGTKQVPSGVSSGSTPANNMGGKESRLAGEDQHQSGLDRYRVNVSLPAAVHRALMGSAAVLGTSASQVALQAIINGLPSLQEQVGAVVVLGGRSRD